MKVTTNREHIVQATEQPLLMTPLDDAEQLEAADVQRVGPSVRVGVQRLESEKGIELFARLVGVDRPAVGSTRDSASRCAQKRVLLVLPVGDVVEEGVVFGVVADHGPRTVDGLRRLQTPLPHDGPAPAAVSEGVPRGMDDMVGKIENDASRVEVAVLVAQWRVLQNATHGGFVAGVVHVVLIAREDTHEALCDGVQVGVGLVQTANPVDDPLFVGIPCVGKDLPV